MSLDAKFWSIVVCCATAILLTVMVLGQNNAKNIRDHEYRMATIKCSEPTNSNKEGE